MPFLVFIPPLIGAILVLVGVVRCILSREARKRWLRVLVAPALLTASLPFDLEIIARDLVCDTVLKTELLYFAPVAVAVTLSSLVFFLSRPRRPAASR